MIRSATYQNYRLISFIFCDLGRMSVDEIRRYHSLTCPDPKPGILSVMAIYRKPRITIVSPDRSFFCHGTGHPVGDERLESESAQYEDLGSGCTPLSRHAIPRFDSFDRIHKCFHQNALADGSDNEAE